MSTDPSALRPSEPEIVLSPFEVPESFKTPDPAMFSVRVETVAGASVVHVGGEVDVLTAPLLWEGLEEAIGVGGAVVIDLAEVSFVDSMGLGVIVRAWKRLREAERPLELRALQPQVLNVFEITGLDSTFGLVP